LHFQNTLHLSDSEKALNLTVSRRVANAVATEGQKSKAHVNDSSSKTSFFLDPITCSATERKALDTFSSSGIITTMSLSSSHSHSLIASSKLCIQNRIIVPKQNIKSLTPRYALSSPRLSTSTLSSRHFLPLPKQKAIEATKSMQAITKVPYKKRDRQTDSTRKRERQKPLK